MHIPMPQFPDDARISEPLIPLTAFELIYNVIELFLGLLDQKSFQKETMQRFQPTFGFSPPQTFELCFCPKYFSERTLHRFKTLGTL